MRYGFAAVLIPIVLAGCGALRSPGEAAAAGCEVAWSRRSGVDAADLVGTFRVVLVVTSFPPEEGWDARPFLLTLRRPDSAEVAASRVGTMGHIARHDLRLVGSVDRFEGRYPAEPAELDGDTLYVGCRDCTDASPWHLTVVDVSTAGFAGSWRDHQTGIGRAVGAGSGTPLPDPAGYYCAYREQDRRWKSRSSGRRNARRRARRSGSSRSGG